MRTADSYRRGFYRSDNGVLLGVFAGLGERFDLSVKGLRLAGIIGLILTGLWPLIGLYLLAALLMKPARSGRSTRWSRFSRSKRDSSERSDYRKSEAQEAMDHRLRNLEDVVTSKEYDWDRRFGQY